MKRILLSLIAVCAVCFLTEAGNNAHKGSRTFYASECGVKLDSDVYEAGCTNQTAKSRRSLRVH